MTYSFELGPIRPPSEAYSLLIRATRNCPWNRCKFCPLYKGEKFQIRPAEEIKPDIRAARAIKEQIKELAWKSGHGERVQEVAGTLLNNSPNPAFSNVALWLYGGGDSTFLQDANTLIMKTGDLVEVTRFLKETFPEIKRVTSYARSKTAARKKPEELAELYHAGLSRLHIGLESGYDPLLQYMGKGVRAADHITGGRRVVESGISLCEYVLLGMGGEKMWREHATQTARMLNEIDPDFIRVRTLAVNHNMPLYDEVKRGYFIRAADERIIDEERLLIEHLECHAQYASDHITNLLQEIEGTLPQDKEKMLATIDRFQALAPAERLNFRIGRRVGIYSRLDDLNNQNKRQMLEQVIRQIRQDGNEINEEMIYRLMARFI